MARIIALTLLLVSATTSLADNLIWSPVHLRQPFGYGGYYGSGTYGYCASSGYNFSSSYLDYGYPYRSYGYYYAAWYDMPFGYSPYGIAPAYGADYGYWPVNMVFSDNNFDRSLGGSSSHQVINFSKPLENGKALLTVTSPPGAEVTVNGQRVTGGFTTPVLSGPTKFEVKVRQNVNGKAEEWIHRVNLKPGDRQQLMVLR